MFEEVGSVLKRKDYTAAILASGYARTIFMTLRKTALKKSK